MPEAEPVTVLVDDEAQLAGELMTATQRITRALIAARAGQLLMLHAGVVSHPDTGASLVYVAPGGTGKTTLSRLLGREFGYITDETAGIDQAGELHAYPKPLSVRRAEQPGLKDEVSPDRLGLLPAPRHCHVARVVLLQRSIGPTQVHLEEMGFMDALFALTEQSSSLPRLNRPLHRLAELIDAVGPVLRVHYAEATDPANDLAALIGGRS